MQLNFNENSAEDLKAILTFLEGMGYNPEGNLTAIRTTKIHEIIAVIRQSFPHKDGMNAASIFKKAAILMLFFISEKPIESDKIGELRIPSDISKFPNHLNTVVAFHLACQLLHNARILSKDGKERILKEKIRLSRHSYIDIIESLCSATPQTHFHLVSVLLEQLAYKTNVECQYDVFEI